MYRCKAPKRIAGAKLQLSMQTNKLFNNYLFTAVAGGAFGRKEVLTFLYKQQSKNRRESPYSAKSDTVFRNPAELYV